MRGGQAASYCREPHPTRCPNWSLSQKKIHHFVVVCFLPPFALPSHVVDESICYRTKVLQNGTTCQKRSKIITEGSFRCYSHTISVRQRTILISGLEVHLNIPRLWKFPGCSTHWKSQCFFTIRSGRWFSQPPFSKAAIYMSLQIQLFLYFNVFLFSGV